MASAFRKKYDIDSNSEHWNMAKDYNRIIQDLLRDFIKYDKIAVNGCENVEYQFQYDTNPSMKTSARLNGISRMVQTQRQIYILVTFAMKKKETPEKVGELKKETMEVETALTMIPETKVDSRTNSQTVHINENKFSMSLEKLRAIQEDLIKYLDANNLIYPPSDEWGEDEWMDNFVNNG